MDEQKASTRIMCMQISVDIVRWDDEMLEKLGITRHGKPATAEEIRGYMNGLKDNGLTCVPCDAHRCDEKGQCTGEPKEPAS